MFSFGELDESVYYDSIVSGKEFAYSTEQLKSDVSEYEKSRWDSFVNQYQFAGMLSSGTEEVPTVSPPVSLAGFSLSENWPILGIIAIGLLLAVRKGPKSQPHRRRKKG